MKFVIAAVAAVLMSCTSALASSLHSTQDCEEYEINAVFRTQDYELLMDNAVNSDTALARKGLLEDAQEMLEQASHWASLYTAFCKD